MRRWGIIVSGFWPAGITAHHWRHARRTPTNTDRRSPASVARACLAYREMRESGASDQEVHEAAVTAVQQVLRKPVLKLSMPLPTPPSITANGSGEANSTLESGERRLATDSTRLGISRAPNRYPTRGRPSTERLGGAWAITVVIGKAMRRGRQRNACKPRQKS